jgi:hypothetical protein
MGLALEILQRTLISEPILLYLHTDLLDHDRKPSEDQVQCFHHDFYLSIVH